MIDSDSTKKSPLIENFDLSLVANFAHQIINPLNGVAGTLDRLYQGKITGEERQKQRINAMRAQVENCIILTRNLAYLAIGFSELKERDKKTVILPQNLIESCMYYQEEAEGRNIKLFVHDRHRQDSVRAHPDLIRQVFMNIIDNAVKYSSDGSTVDIYHHIQKSSNMAIITIQSQPINMITPDDMKKVFDVGFRGSNAKKVVASGSGLGLFICKEIIQTSHRGSIYMNKHDQKKVEFIIRIPEGLTG